jgi:RimJ/RimL family protein N-acetyltransferase
MPTIRRVAWSDFEAITEIYFSLYEEVQANPDLGITLFASRPPAGEEAEWFGRLHHRILDGNSIAVVAEEEGRAVGLCTVDRRGPATELGHIGILGIMVAEKFRGRGLGRALLNQAIAQSAGKFELIELAVFASNTHARALYRSVGFRPWGMLPRGVRRNGRYTDLEYMVIDIDAAPAASPPG